jgi:hypothetical protein
MYCPSCGSEERQPSQYCRACGTDLRAVRQNLERPDAVTASAVTSRDQISRALADKIRDLDSAKDLKRVAEDVLPQFEKFIESHEEKRLRRIRAGMVLACIGLGATLVAIILGNIDQDFLPFLFPSVVSFFIGLAILINGLVFTLPHKKVRDRSLDALTQDVLDARARTGGLLEASTSDIGIPAKSPERAPTRVSVTEHTTKHLDQV